MDKEHPVKLSRPNRRKSGTAKNVSEKICILHFRQNKSDTTIKPLTDKTFEKIKSVVAKRQASDEEHIRLDDICSAVPAEVNQYLHGIHRWCYQSFTNTSSYLKRRRFCDDSTKQCHSASKRSRVSEASTLLPYECIFCGKVRKSIKRKEEPLTKCLTATAENSIKDAADRKRDEELLCKIRNVDLIAKEAYYHPTCRKVYTIARESLDESAIDDGLTKAHKNAFIYVCNYVMESVVKGGNVMRMTMLREKYLQFIMDNSPEYYNPSYKTDKLKDKLRRQFQGQIQFWQPNYRSELVYSSTILKGQAVETAFELAASDERFIEDCAMMLRRNILDLKEGQSFSEWPPRAANLLSMSRNVVLPCLLEHFLVILLCGKNDPTVSNKTQRLANSFGQDLCHAVTNGRLKLPKHLLLGMTLRHMTGSAEILTLMNHFGHCQSYSQVLELETAMCNSTIGREHSIPAPISPTNNIITHLCWDNFDLNEETPSGSGTTHSAHGIVIQETTDRDVTGEPRESSTQPAEITRSRSVDYQPENIPECFLTNKAEPVINTSIVAVGECVTVELASASDFAWFLCRKILLHVKQLVPSWSGWVSLTTGTEHTKQSVVEYMPPVNAPMTENAKVQKVLQESQKVSEAVGQRYKFVTFDLAVAKKAYAIAWQNPKKCIKRRSFTSVLFTHLLHILVHSGNVYVVVDSRKLLLNRVFVLVVLWNRF